MNSKFLVFQSNIHAALCDNIDTRSSLDNVRELVSVANIYMDSCKDQKSIINRQLLVTISSYITNLFDIFGLVSKGGKSVGFPVSSGEGEVDMETLVMPYLDVLAEFRDVVRVEARKIKVIPAKKVFFFVMEKYIFLFLGRFLFFPNAIEFATTVSPISESGWRTKKMRGQSSKW